MSIGARLKEERIRLGKTQTDFAAIAGVTKSTQISWEKDASSPTANALVAFAEAGADALYILSGRRQSEPFDIRAEANFQATLAHLQETIHNPRYEAERTGMTMLEVVEGCRLALIKIATSTSPNVTDLTRAEADEILRMQFDDPGAAKRRSARFAEEMLSRQSADKNVEDILRGIGIELPRNLHHQLLMLVIDYQINTSDLLPFLSELKEPLERLRALENLGDDKQV